MKLNRREFIFGGASLLAFPTTFAHPEPKANLELNDLVEFSKTCTIDNIKDGVIKFNPRPYQIEYFKNILESNIFVCRKCRQCGTTTMNLIYAHWVAERHPEKNVVVVFSNNMIVEEAKHRFNSMFPTNSSKWYENTPNVEFVTYNSFISSCNNYIQNKDCCTSSLYTNAYLNSNTILVFEEYAFHDFIGVNLSDVKSIWVSTQNRPTDVMWGDGKNKRNMTRMKITWRDIPGRDDAWKNRQVEIIGQDRFNQEFEV
mgnify:CR=1 FL=1